MSHAPTVRTVRHDINTKPFIVIWEVTRACALVCKHCRADAQHHANPRLHLTISDPETHSRAHFLAAGGWGKGHVYVP